MQTVSLHTNELIFDDNLNPPFTFSYLCFVCVLIATCGDIHGVSFAQWLSAKVLQSITWV